MGGLPNGPGGVNPDAKFVNSASGLGELDQLTRPNVEALLKEMHFPPTNIWRNPGGILKTAWNAMTAAISNAATNAVNAITQLGTLIWTVGGDFIEDVGDFINAAVSNAQTALTNSGITLANLENALKGAFNKWFNRTDGTGTVAEFEYVMESVRDAVINGYLVTAFTSDAVAWPVTPAVDWNTALIGGGQNASGGTGGLHGSFIARPLDMAGVTAIDVQIGTAGNLTTIRVAATPPHAGAVLAQSAPHGTSGGVALQGGLYGLSPTNSLPGSGGNGGSGGPGGTEATPGQDSALATGGARGLAGNFGGNGQPGGSVSAGSQIKCGGAGGGGGGRANVVLNGGGNGGAGGYPGGGGGGRGAGWGGGPNGLLGPGAPGVAFVMRKGEA